MTNPAKAKSIENAEKLFEFLEKLSLLNSNVRKSVKKLSSEEELFDVEDEEFLPKVDKIFLKNRDPEADKDNILFSIERYKIENPPKLPKELEKWVSYENITYIAPQPLEFIYLDVKFDDDKERVQEYKNLDKKITPPLVGWVTEDEHGEITKITEKSEKVFFSEFPELQDLFDKWLEAKWKPWKDKNKEYFISNQAYDKIYSIRSFLKTEEDNFDLVWSHDIITWKDKKGEIYHPTFFSPVVIDFDLERNIIYVKEDPNSTPFFDVSFIREALDDNSQNLPDIDTLSESINKELSSGEMNMWDYDLLNRYLLKLVRHISPDGDSKYKNRLEKISPSSAPIAYNHHGLFLFKKGAKLWADYSVKIKDDIGNSGELTPFLEDLILNEHVREDGSEEDLDNELNNKERDGELYFPLPYNEEQKQIANQVGANYGAVVQGPPGTGKTHTIANLVSRFLAQGKTVLVTSQTGQALSVLKNKIPEEIRSLAVSQVDSASRNNDIQASVSEINSKLNDKTKYTEKKKESVERELKRIREDLASKNKEFERKILIDSRENITIEEEVITPIEAGEYVSNFHDKSEFIISDEIKHDLDITISQKDFENYVFELEQSDKKVWELADLDTIPSVEFFPSIDLVKKYSELLNNLSQEEKKLSDQYVPSKQDLKLTDQAQVYIQKLLSNKESSEYFSNLLDERGYVGKQDRDSFFEISKKNNPYDVKKQIDEAKKIRVSFQEDWEIELFNLMTNESEKQKWQMALESLFSSLDELGHISKILLTKKIDISNEYDFDFVKSLSLISTIEDKADKESGSVKKGLSVLFQSDIKKLFKYIKVGHTEIKDMEDLIVVKSYFEKQKIESEIRDVWNKLFADNKNQVEIDDSFNKVDFETQVKQVERIVLFREKYADLKRLINIFNLFEPDEINVSDLGFLEKTEKVFTGFINTIEQTNIEEQLSKINAQLLIEKAHPLIQELTKAISAYDIESINSLVLQISELSKTQEQSKKMNELEKEIFNTEIKKIEDSSNNHLIVKDIVHGLRLGDYSKLTQLYNELPKLKISQEKSLQIKKMEEELSEFLPKTLVEIKRAVADNKKVNFEVKENIKYARLISWLNELHKGDTIDQLSRDIRILKEKERNEILNIVEISSWMHLKERVTKRQKEALSSFALSMKKYGKGTGKYAPKHLKDAKNALEVGKEAVPVWIMPMNTVPQLFPSPKAGMFDVVIFDEASQVDVRGLNVAYIGKKLLVVGDDEQVSPTSFTKQTKVTDLVTRYISDVPNSHQFSNTSSLFDVAKIKMTDGITLTEHFRSIEEIIGFSNKLSYNGNLKILRDQLPKDRLDPVLEAVYVKEGYEETNVGVNKKEAELIIEKIKEIISDEKYKETKDGEHTRPITLGVISLLGKDQSKLITKLISEKIASKEIEERKIVCGDPYTFQGDERDIIVLSMVKAPDLHHPEKNIHPYTVSTTSYKQRINVAMSRAKNKMILFHSIPVDKLTNPDDLRKQIIDWFYNQKIEEKKAGLAHVREEVSRGRASEFEYAVAEIIANNGFKVVPQYEVAGYRIDLVIQGENAKLAVECDGDKYHNRLDKWQEDIDRQQIIERAGWTFWRVSGSSFYKNKEKALDSLWKKLEEMDIKPTN